MSAWPGLVNQWMTLIGLQPRWAQVLREAEALPVSAGREQYDHLLDVMLSAEHDLGQRNLRAIGFTHPYEVRAGLPFWIAVLVALLGGALLAWWLFQIVLSLPTEEWSYRCAGYSCDELQRKFEARASAKWWKGFWTRAWLLWVLVPALIIGSTVVWWLLFRLVNVHGLRRRAVRRAMVDALEAHLLQVEKTRQKELMETVQRRRTLDRAP